MYLYMSYMSKPWLFRAKTPAKRHWHWMLHLTTSLMQRHSLYMHIYVLIMKQLLLADEVVVNSSQVPFQPQSWQLCRWPMSGDAGQLQ